MATLTRTKPTAKPTAVEAAREDVERLFRLEISLSRGRIEMSERLPDAMEAAGAALVDARLAGSREKDDEDVLKLRVKIEQHDHAIAQARKMRLEALGNLAKVEADELRAEAASKRKEADSMRAPIEKLLDKIEESAGVRPVWPSPPESPRAGAVGYSVKRFNGPNFRGLESEAKRLDAQANQRERKKIRSSGQLHGASVEGMLDEVEALGPFVLAPKLVAVHEFVGAGMEEQRKRQSHIQATAVGGRDEIRASIWFNQGEINQRSSVSLPSLDC